MFQQLDILNTIIWNISLMGEMNLKSMNYCLWNEENESFRLGYLFYLLSIKNVNLTQLDSISIATITFHE